MKRAITLLRCACDRDRKSHVHAQLACARANCSRAPASYVTRCILAHTIIFYRVDLLRVVVDVIIIINVTL